MVTFKFMEDKGGQLKIHSTISKKARGAFLTSLIENQVQTVEEACRLSFAGFVYREGPVPTTGIDFCKGSIEIRYFVWQYVSSAILVYK